MARKEQVIYVDIDGTLTAETEGWGTQVYKNRTPRKDVIEFVNKKYDSGCTVIIWTARHEEDFTDTMMWLHKHGVKFHSLIMNKPHFDLYICDKVVNVNDLFTKTNT